MIDEKQIEEIQGLLVCKKWDQPFVECEESIACIACIAKQIYNVGYRKIPKNAVVLTDKKLELGEYKGEVQVMCMARETYDAVLKQACKETARKILQKIKEVKTQDCGYTDWLDDTYFGDEFQKIAKEYGVEVEE